MHLFLCEVDVAGGDERRCTPGLGPKACTEASSKLVQRNLHHAHHRMQTKHHSGQLVQKQMAPSFTCCLTHRTALLALNFEAFAAWKNPHAV